ncbi:hypothetical protein IH776_26710 [Escherichia coli]|nr:hypothetical protein [Escherichia coli]
MKSVVLLETTNELAAVVQHWHSSVLAQITEMAQVQAGTGNHNYVQALNDVYALIHKLPYNAQYTITQEVMVI